MLNLTMRPGDYVLIGDEIRITYTGSRGNGICLDISAPRSMNVLRNKLYERIIEKKAAEGDQEAIQVNEAIIADKEERERERLANAQISAYVKQRKAQKKLAKQAKQEQALM